MNTPHELPSWAAGSGTWAYGARIAHGTPADFCEDAPGSAPHDEFAAEQEALLEEAWKA